ncbi:hypothetical protein GF391_00980 [Candidatus Uhrbacteria bacterium]|nr:hypothetical protein [Candidatus Uhrbacteria bacterium]
MNLHINPQKLAIGIIFLAMALFIVGAGYSIYTTYSESYIAGSPPKELIEKIPPKQVPYDQIKPPAIAPDDAFIIGSPSSTYGIVFYGDYANSASNQLLVELMPALEPYGELIRLNYRHLPEATKDGSMGFEAAVASECSRLLGTNWLLHHLLIQTNPDKLSISFIRNTIETTSAQSEIIKACQFNTPIREKIATAIARAKGDGIDKAPFVFVGTQAIPAKSATKDQIIDALKRHIR